MAELSRIDPSNVSSTDDRDALLRKIRELEDRCRRAEAAYHAEEAQNRLLAESAPFGIFVLDPEGIVFAASQKLMEMLAWPEDQDIHELNMLTYPPMVASGAAAVFRRCMQTRSRMTSDHACMAGTRECVYQRFHVSPVIDTDGHYTGIIVFVEDVTELKRAEEAILASEKKYRSLFESAPVAMVERDAGDLKKHLEALRASGITDLRSYFDVRAEELDACLRLIKTVDCNSAYLKMMEAASWEEIVDGFRLSNSPDYVTRMAQEIISMVAEGNISIEREETFVTVKGTRKSILAKSLPLTGHEDTLSRIVVAMVDITKRKEAEEALRASEQRFREQAMRDILTGLYNRRYLYQSLAELVEHARVNGLVVSVIFMDLDHFKNVVDTYGHLNGSHTIKEVGQTIREAIDRPAFAVAYAGDEFVVVLPSHGPEQAIEKAKEIQHRIRNHVFLRDQGLEVSIRSSFGIATFPHHAENMTDLLAAADKALFVAKGSGKDRIRSSD